MRRSSPLVRQGNDVDMDSAMTPMIDVVFLLLVFFVWTASFQVVEHVLPSDMSAQIGSEANPDIEPPPPKDFEDVVVKIGFAADAPSFQVNGQPVTGLDEVEQQLKTIGQIDNTVPVILAPVSAVPLGIVIETYDTANVAGFLDVRFAITPQGR